MCKPDSQTMLLFLMFFFDDRLFFCAFDHKTVILKVLTQATSMHLKKLPISFFLIFLEHNAAAFAPEKACSCYLLS